MDPHGLDWFGPLYPDTAWARDDFAEIYMDQLLWDLESSGDDTTTWVPTTTTTNTAADMLFFSNTNVVPLHEGTAATTNNASAANDFNALMTFCVPDGIDVLSCAGWHLTSPLPPLPIDEKYSPAESCSATLERSSFADESPVFSEIQDWDMGGEMGGGGFFDYNNNNNNNNMATTTTTSADDFLPVYALDEPMSMTTTAGGTGFPPSSSASTTTTPSSASSSTPNSSKHLHHHICPHCGAGPFPDKTKLTLHTNKHTKPFRCSSSAHGGAGGCDAAFAEKKSLQRHLVARAR